MALKTNDQACADMDGNPADARLEFDCDGSVVFHDGSGVPLLFDSLPIDGRSRSLSTVERSSGEKTTI